MRKPKVLFFLLTAALLLSSCGDETGSSGPINPYAVISTVASNYTSSATAFIDNAATRTAYNDYNALKHSDHVVNTYGEYFFDIERYGKDAITKFHKGSATTPIWNYSTMDSNDTTEGITTSNPYQIIHVSDTKAYLLRYGSKRSWIVNPSATSSSSFKIGELDLSSYTLAADTDGKPEATEGVIVDGKLYVLCQNYDGNTYGPAGNSTLAVFDVSTNAIVDANGTSDGTAIDLGLKNGLTMKVVGTKIYVACINNRATASGAGVAIIDTSSNTASTSVSNRIISDIAISSATKGYLVEYAGWGSNSLYSFNPSTGVVGSSPVASISGRNIADIEIAPDGKLWLSDASSSTAGVYIIDTSTDTIEQGPMSTNLMPQNISFLE